MPDPTGPPAEQGGAHEAIHVTKTTVADRREDDQQEEAE
jgi:hypothetical protein